MIKRVFYIINVPTFLLTIILLPYVFSFYLNYHLNLPKGFSPLNMVSIYVAGLILFPVVGILNLVGIKERLFTVLGWGYIVTFVLLLWSICYTLFQE